MAGVAATLAILAMWFAVPRTNPTKAPPTPEPGADVRLAAARPIARDAGSPRVSDAAIAQVRVDRGIGAERDGAVARSREAPQVLPHVGPLVRVAGSALVNLAGGPPTIRPYGMRTAGPTRMVTGHVLDRAGQPVAGAIVLADAAIRIEAGNIMAADGATTDATGAFTLERAPTGSAAAIALVRDDWSDLVELGDTPAELRMTGHGTLTGTLTYDGGGDTFELALRMRGRPFSARTKSDPDGRFEISSLPPGTYTLTAGLAQGFGGGQSRTIDRELTIEVGHTSKVELALEAGTTVAMFARVRSDLAPAGLKYWLFSGAAPASGAEARERTSTDHPPNMAVGGGLRASPAAFHDVRPGTYAGCAGVFDVQTMDALDQPFACTTIEVHADERVRELEISLEP